MKRNSDKDKVDKNLVDYITDVRKNIDCPRIYLPYIETNIKGIYSINNTFNKWVNDAFGFTNVSIKIKLKEGCSDEEKRNAIKEAICRFIDIALDEYEVRKEEEGLNKLAKVDRSKEVEEAKKRLEKNKCIIDLGKEIYDSYFEDEKKGVKESVSKSRKKREEGREDKSVRKRDKGVYGFKVCE